MRRMGYIGLALFLALLGAGMALIAACSGYLFVARIQHDPTWLFMAVAYAVFAGICFFCSWESAGKGV